jgi:hypothetical protein
MNQWCGGYEIIIEQKFNVITVKVDSEEMAQKIVADLIQKAISE